MTAETYQIHNQTSMMTLQSVINISVPGWAYDMTGRYPISFFISGGVAILASVLLIPVRNYRHDAAKQWTRDKLESLDTNKPCRALLVNPLMPICTF